MRWTLDELEKRQRYIYATVACSNSQSGLNGLVVE
jgi:hypothetical protein